ncbi:MAG: chorismate synthase [Sulfolobales archaeon]|nr:chorismate synthase [Sulfolobales archaeon]
MSFSFGRLFRISVFGESHGLGVGVVVDGCPAGLNIDESCIQAELDRRKAKNSEASTQRREGDRVRILSGVFNGTTTGSPICMFVFNEDVRSDYYELIRFRPRPGHADYVAHVKYGGFNDFRGGGTFSGRITVGMVAAGAVALKLLSRYGIKVVAHTVNIGGVWAENHELNNVDHLEKLIEVSPVGCADLKASNEMLELIRKASELGETVGGVAEVIAVNVPPGVGEPLFDTLEGDLAKAFFAIPGVKGVEFGVGFKAASMFGSQYNDQFSVINGKVVTNSNNSGGIQGGISNGMPIVCRVAFRPPASIKIPQKTVDLRNYQEVELMLSGRFDTCIVPRALPVLRSMAAVVLTDHLMISQKIPRVLK